MDGFINGINITEDPLIVNSVMEIICNKNHHLLIHKYIRIIRKI
jgi:hypothetical protein